MVAMKQFYLILLLITCCIFSAPVQSQLLEPVKWEVSASETGLNEYTLIFKATIDEGWKVYSHFLPEAEIRPIPTTIMYDEMPEGLELVGEMEELGSKKSSVEPLFDNL